MIMRKLVRFLEILIFVRFKGCLQKEGLFDACEEAEKGACDWCHGPDWF
jgi:hypothetical protein